MSNLKILSVTLCFSVPSVAMGECAAVDGGVDTSSQSYVDLVLSGEGGGKWHATNDDSSATGAFQFVYQTLKDLGYIDKSSPDASPAMHGDSSWDTAIWTGKNGVNSREEFMANQSAQVAALAEFTQSNLDKIGTEDYGKVVNGVEITAGGTAYASHFLGAGGFNKWKSCGYQPSCLYPEILDYNPGTFESINEMLMERMAEGAGIDPTCISTDGFEGEIPLAFLMPWSE